MKRIWYFTLALFCFATCPFIAAQEPMQLEITKPVIMVQEVAVVPDEKHPLSQAAIKNKERVSRALKKKRAVTIKLKQGAVYYYVPNYSPEVKQTPAENVKIAGRIEQVGEDQFWIGERGLTGWQYLTLRVRYEDVEDVHFNLIPNGAKSTGEFLYYCVLLLPFGICDP